jgi:SulP family sulfate permease
MGFTTAAALLTMASTARDLLGAPFPRGAVLQDFFAALPAALPRAHAPTALVAALALALLLALPRWPRARGVPAPLVVVAFFTAGFALAMAAAGDDGGRGAGTPAATRSGVALVGAVAGGFPAFAAPPLSLALFYQLAPTAASVTFVGFVESVAVAKLYAAKHGYEVATESELKALGLANIVGAALQSFPVMGAFGRSAVNDAAGAESQISGVVAAATVAVAIAALTPALFFLAKPVLAALIVAAVSGLVDLAGLRRLFAADRRDFAVCLAALAATLLLGVLPGVLAAMTFSLVLFLAETTQPRVEELGRREGTVQYEPLHVLQDFYWNRCCFLDLLSSGFDDLVLDGWL